MSQPGAGSERMWASSVTVGTQPAHAEVERDRRGHVTGDEQPVRVDLGRRRPSASSRVRRPSPDGSLRIQPAVRGRDACRDAWPGRSAAVGVWRGRAAALVGGGHRRRHGVGATYRGAPSGSVPAVISTSARTSPALAQARSQESHAPAGRSSSISTSAGPGSGADAKCALTPERVRVVAAFERRRDHLREQVAAVDLVADRPGRVEVDRRCRSRLQRYAAPGVMRPGPMTLIEPVQCSAYARISRVMISVICVLGEPVTVS